MKISKNFYSEEFLPKELHKYINDKGLNPMWYIDKDMVDFCEWLKEECNGAKITINDWKWKGQYNYSGFRGPKDIGAELSQHKFKDAIDIKVEGYTIAQLREIMIANFMFLNKSFGISTIEKVEKTPTWLHVDKRWTGLSYLLEVNG